MISVAFVALADTFKPYNSVTPVAITTNVLSYKFSGYEAIGVDYYKVEPEHVSITLDTGGLDALIQAGYDNSNRKSWGYSAYLIEDGRSLFNGIIPITTVKLIKENYIIEFEIYDLVKSMIYVNDELTYQIPQVRKDSAKALLSQAMSRNLNNLRQLLGSAHPAINYNDNNATYDGEFYTDGGLLISLPEIDRFRHFTVNNKFHWFYPLDGIETAHDNSDYWSRWFVGFGTWSYRIDYNEPLMPPTPQLMIFKFFYGTSYFSDGYDGTVALYRWFFDQENPISYMNVHYNSLGDANTTPDWLINERMRALIPDYDSIVSQYCNVGSVMPMSYDSPFGWSISAEILIYSETTEYVYSPVGRFNPLQIRLTGALPGFTPLEISESTPESILNNDTISNMLRLNNWTMIQEDTNTIRLIDKLRTRGSSVVPIEINENILSTSIKGNVIARLDRNGVTFDFLKNKNVDDALRVYYRALFDTLRTVLEIETDSDAVIPMGSKIRYEGKEYYVFGIYRENTSIRYKCYGVS